MSVQRRNSWDIQPPREPDSTTHEVSLSAWAFEYGVVPALVPFELRSYDPVSIVKSIREGMAEAPQTKASFTAAEIRDLAGIEPNGVGSYQRRLIRLASSWELSDGGHYDGRQPNARWVNPNYIHASALEPAIKETRYRIEELRHAASIGILTLADIAPRFGVSDRTAVNKFCEYWGISWSDWRQWGKRRISRTARLILEWTDHTTRSVAATLGLPQSTLVDWIHEYYAADFEVPPDPSHEAWFGISETGGDDS